MSKRILFVFCCLCSMMSVFSQSEKSDSLFAAGVELYKAGKYKEAIPLFAESDRLDKEELDSTSNRRDYSSMWLASCYYHIGDTLIARTIHEMYQLSPIDRRLTVISDSLSEIGGIYYQNGDFQNALNYFLQCLEIENRMFGEKHFWYAKSIINCARLYYHLNDTAKALHYMQEGVKIIKNNYEENSAQYIAALREYGDLLYFVGYVKQAVGVYKEVLQIMEKVLGKDHLDYATSLHNLALYQSELGNYTEAVRLGELALQIMEKVLGKEHPKYATSLNNLALYQSELGNYTEAVRLGESALQIREKVLGKEHPDYAKSLNDLADIQSELGNYTEAARLCESALQIREKVLGKEHLDYASSLNNLADIQSKLGNYTEAARLCESALQIVEKVLGKEQPYYATMLHQLAVHQSNLGHYTEAVRLQEECMQIEEKVLGKEHPDHATSLYCLAKYQSYLGNYTEAVRLGESALQIREKVLGKEHPDYARSLGELSWSQYHLGNYTEAVRLCESALQIMEKVLGKEHPDYTELLNKLAGYQSHLGNYTEAVRLQEECIQIEEKVLGKEYSGYDIRLNNLGLFQFYLGNYAEAVRLGESALQIREKLLGKENYYYAISLNNLGLFQFYLGNYTEAVRLQEECMQIEERVLGKEHSLLALSLQRLALYHSVLGNFNQLNFYAEESFSLSSSNLLRLFSDLNSYGRSQLWEKEKSFFQKNLCQYAYSFPSDTLRSLAYDGALLSKGLLLNSELELKKLILEHGDAEILKLYNELHTEKLFLQKIYEKPINERNVNTDSLEQRISLLEKELIAKSKIYGDYTNNLRVTWKDVLSKLEQKDVSVEFASFPLRNDSTMYVAFVLQKGMTTPEMIPLFEEKQLKNESNLYKDTYVSNLVWKPLSRYLEGKKNVFFAPSGELYNIGIENLPHWDGNGLMSDSWNMYRLSSTRELATIKDRNPLKQASVYGGIKYDTDEEMLIADSRKYLSQDHRSFDFEPFAIADSINMRAGAEYLPSTKIEAEDIDKTLEQKKIMSNLLIDTLATEGSFKNLSGKKENLLHIATHGFYWTEKEAKYRDNLDFLMLDSDHKKYVEDKALTRSGLLLAGANNALKRTKLPEGVDDGILTAKEISQLDLRGLDLVVLSACQTGLGEIKGDGVFGLQRGFKKAGANSILMSLWKVDDKATSLLMMQFYKNITSGMSKYESLKQAQKYVREYEEEVEIKSDARPSISAHAKEQAQRNATKEKTYKKVRKYEDPYYWAAFILLDALD